MDEMKVIPFSGYIVHEGEKITVLLSTRDEYQVNIVVMKDGTIESGSNWQGKPVTLYERLKTLINVWIGPV